MNRYYSKFLAAVTLSLSVMTTSPVFAAAQDQFSLPEEFLTTETEYLKEFPELQKIMDVMIDTAKEQLENPEQEILHNRVCTALVYQMTSNGELSDADRRLALAGDLLHNIAKEDQDAVLTDPAQLAQANQLITELKQAGYFSQAPGFWNDESILTNPKVGKNRGLIHHITGAMEVGALLKQIGGFTPEEIQKVQAAVAEHSTGYWYFRGSVDNAADREGAWETVFPEPESDIAKYVHDADLVSQFVPESVIPDGAKWRELAKNRWGATTPQEEGHIVYYVFMRLYEEAKTESGKELVLERWNQIVPALVNLMGLEEGQDPIKKLGVPAVFVQ